MSLKSDKISLQWRRLVEVILLFLFPSFRPGTFSGIIYFRQDRVVVIDVAGDTREEFRTPASHVEELFSVSRVERTNERCSQRRRCNLFSFHIDQEQ